MNNTLYTTACFYGSEAPIFMLRNSCQKQGIDLTPYGVGKGFTNWRQAKLDELIPFLETREEELVIYSDGSDSFVLSPLEEILLKYKELETPILVSGEQSLYPGGIYNFPESQHLFRFICAGCFMGERIILLDILKRLQQTYNDPNDQFAWNKGFADGWLRTWTKIDYNCEVFQSMQNFDNYAIMEQRLHNNVTGSTPCILHFNGGKGGSPVDLAMHELYRELI